MVLPQGCLLPANSVEIITRRYKSAAVPTRPIGRISHRTSALPGTRRRKGCWANCLAVPKPSFAVPTGCFLRRRHAVLSRRTSGPNAGKTIGATALVPGQPGQTILPAFYTLSDIVANPLTASSFAFTTTDYKKVINQADQTFARTISGFDPTLARALHHQLDLWRSARVVEGHRTRGPIRRQSDAPLLAHKQFERNEHL